MYECALRLNVEGVREKGVRQQGKCYLACLNCLQHIPQQEAWIVRPLAAQFAEETSSLPNKGNHIDFIIYIVFQFIYLLLSPLLSF